ncbi:hypothetical protein BVY01_00415, partial [bacterium I07]
DTRARESLQLGIYALAYQNTYQQPVKEVELHFLESGLIGVAEMTEKRIIKTQEQIEAAAAGIRSRQYEAKPGYQSCRYCAYVDICPSAVRA